MNARAVRTPPLLRYRGGKLKQSSAFEQCAKVCAFPDVQLDCIKYLKLGEKTLTALIQINDSAKKAKKTKPLAA